MTAAEVKEALRRRHPADSDFAGPGPWTVLEEWMNIDLVAFSAWSSKKPPIVGYEVKVSRGDYRRELLKPDKRAASVEGCWAFYFAVPKGLLTKEEKAYLEPEHFEDGQAFMREKCPEQCRRPRKSYYLEERLSETEKARRRSTGKEVSVPTAYGDEACLRRPYSKDEKGAIVNPATAPKYEVGGTSFRWEICSTCGGVGYLKKSVVEEEAPTLWVPKDVGLVEVDPETGGCRTIRKAPVSEPTREWSITHLVRWASYRPDPRHHDSAVAA